MPTVHYTELRVPEFIADFTGRIRMTGFDATKRYSIAECNRDFVWPPALREEFVRSVLNGDPLPSLILCNNQLIDGGNRATTLWLYQNNRFRVDGNNFSDLTFDQQAAWTICKMPVTMIEGATDEEKSDYYEKFNNGVTLTFGQKLENRRTSPIAAASFDLIGHGPLQDLIRRVWSPVITKTKSRAEVTFAYKVLTASIRGSEYFYPTWANASTYIAETPANAVDYDHLRDILTVIKDVDPTGNYDQKRKKFCFEKFIGAVIHDSWRMRVNGVHTQPFINKWTRFFEDAYDDVLTIRQLRELCSYKSINIGRGAIHRSVATSENIDEYIQGRFVFTNVVDEDDDD